MSNDDLSGAPEPKKVSDQTDGPDGTVQPSNGWRSYFLLGATIVFIVMGQLFRFASQSGQEPPSLEGPQQLLSVYTTDPNATAHLSVDVIWQAQNANTSLLVPYDGVFLSISGPGLKPSTMVLVRSSLPAVTLKKNIYGQYVIVDDPTFKKTRIVPPLPGFLIDQNSDYVLERPVGGLMSNSPGGPGGTGIGVFELPGAVAESYGSYFAHLPTVGFAENSGYQYSPSFLSVLNTITPSEASVCGCHASEDLIENPQLNSTAPVTGRESLNPAAYRSFGIARNLYWQPAVLNTSETLTGAESLFTNTNVNVQPGNGVLEDFNYTWQGTGGIDPMINATEDSA